MELNRRESLNLFNRLMFSRDNNLVNMEFIEEVAALAGGLPLVLEVWSRYFIGHERKQWPSLLEKLKRIPHGDVQKQLQMSYDSLGVTAKNLFLDIACFFDGMYKESVVKVLQDEESAFFPDIEIQHLVDKFLVKDPDQYNQSVTMNHVIKEMGHEVVRQENPEEPGQRTRLMGHRDVVRVFREYSGTDSVRSIQDSVREVLVSSERATVQLEAFKKMSNLRYIQLENSKLQWSSSSNDDMSCYSFKQLRYLEWHHFPCKSLDNFDMGNVVVIMLHKSKLEKLWDGVKNFKKLKTLDVSGSYLLTKTGNFIGLENLEKLFLRECFNLEELDSSIGFLQKLASLDLSDCSRLKRFPWESIGKLTSLQNLNLQNCSNIPDSTLEIGSLISLEVLNLQKTKLTSLPNSLCQLHQLTHLLLSGCTNLKSIPDLPLNIQCVYAKDCENLVNLPSNCSELQFLTELHLNGCCKLGSEGFTQVVTTLRNLQELNMKNCNISQVSSGIGNLVSLVSLDLSGNTFSSLPESFSNLSKLKYLYISECSQLQLLPLLPSQLTYIAAPKCESLDVMPFDSRQKAYTFPSKVFKESLMNTKGLHIGLSEEEVPEWCTYRNSGNVLSFVAPLKHFNNKICGVIFCATTDPDLDFLTIHNKTKEESHVMEIVYHIGCTLKVTFYPLNDKTVLVEAGDTVELRFNDDNNDYFMSFGLRLIYEEDMVDSGFVLKFGAETTLPLPSVMSGTQSSDNDDCFFSIPDDLPPWYLDLEQFVMQGMPSAFRGDQELA